MYNLYQNSTLLNSLPYKSKRGAVNRADKIALELLNCTITIQNEQGEIIQTLHYTNGDRKRGKGGARRNAGRPRKPCNKCDCKQICIINTIKAANEALKQKIESIRQLNNYLDAYKNATKEDF